MVRSILDVPGHPDYPFQIFVPEFIKLRGVSEPAAIGTSARLLKAPEALQLLLKEILHPYIATRWNYHLNPWEVEITQADNGMQYRPVDNPENNFWIIEHWRRVVDKQLEFAPEISDPGLTPLVAFRGPNPIASQNSVMDGHAIVNWLDDNLLAGTREIGSREIASIESTWTQLIALDENNDSSVRFVRNSIRDFTDLKRVAARLPLYVVGLFAIIEKLLTTPQDKTTENSLSHQLKEKLTLFGNRFSDPISLSNHFSGASEIPLKTVISKLYTYRSMIAHGSEVDFSGGLQILQSHETVCIFLRVLVRKLLLQATLEPTLFRDIKNC